MKGKNHPRKRRERGFACLASYWPRYKLIANFPSIILHSTQWKFEINSIYHQRGAIKKYRKVVPWCASPNHSVNWTIRLICILIWLTEKMYAQNAILFSYYLMVADFVRYFSGTTISAYVVRYYTRSTIFNLCSRPQWEWI